VCGAARGDDGAQRWRQPMHEHSAAGACLLTARTLAAPCWCITVAAAAAAAVAAAAGALRPPRPALPRPAPPRRAAPPPPSLTSSLRPSRMSGSTSPRWSWNSPSIVSGRYLRAAASAAQRGARAVMPQTHPVQRSECPP
jgi:hypothetical protein